MQTPLYPVHATSFSVSLIYHVHLEGFVGLCSAMFYILVLVLCLFCFALLSSNASSSYSLSAPSSMGSLSLEGFYGEFPFRAKCSEISHSASMPACRLLLYLFPPALGSFSSDC